MLNDRINWDLRDGLARITLARGSGNAMDLATAKAMREAVRRVAAGAADGSVRVAMLAAQGSAFSVGGDLREFSAAADRQQQVSAVADEFHRAILALSDIQVPVISVIHGTVAGGGVGLALAADIVLMAAEATMRLAYTAAGLSPDCGATWVLARRLGPARAMDLALTNRVLTGTEAAAWGLVSRAVPSAELAETVEKVTAGLLSGPADAYAETKRLISAARDRDLPSQLEDESATIGKLAAGANGMEGIDAFLAKRVPVFRP